MFRSRKVLVEKCQNKRQMNSADSTNTNRETIDELLTDDIEYADSNDEPRSRVSNEKSARKLSTVRFNISTDELENVETKTDHVEDRKLSNVFYFVINNRATDVGLKALEDFVASLRQSSLLRRSMEIKRKIKYSRTTRNLLIISACYVILNTPMVISKFGHFFETINYAPAFGEKFIQNYTIYSVIDEQEFRLYNNASKNSHDQVEILQKLATYSYYLNFSINFFLYVFSSSEFKEAIFGFFKFK